MKNIFHALSLLRSSAVPEDRDGDLHGSAKGSGLSVRNGCDGTEQAVHQALLSRPVQGVVVEYIGGREEAHSLTDNDVRGEVLVGEQTGDADGFDESVSRDHHIPVRILS